MQNNLRWQNRQVGAESAQLYPAAEMSNWIFYQGKSNFPEAGPGRAMLILL
jgi:hypothetical protein